MFRIMFKLRLPAVIVAAACALMLSAAGAQAAPIGAYTTKGAWSFVSAPNLHPPMLGRDAEDAVLEAHVGLLHGRELQATSRPSSR